MQKFLVAVSVMAYLFVLPFTVSAAGLVPCGGSGQDICQTCHVVSLVNNVVAWLVMILGTIAAILIVVAGVRLVTSGGNVSAKEEAKSSMTNLLIGYLIVLSAWLVLDYGLKALLIEGGSGSFGVWNEISCVDQPKAASSTVTQIPVDWIETQSPAPYVDPIMVIGAGGSGGTGGSYPTGMGQCSPGNSACSVAALQAAGLNSQQANIMSCLAMTESTGNPSSRNPTPGSTACGTWQVLRPTWNGIATGACANFSSCTNASCNMKVAVALVRQSGYSSWTCPGCNKKAAACVKKFGG